MHTYFDKLFVKHQRRFGKGYIAQHCILVMTGKMKEARDKKYALQSSLIFLKRLIVFLFGNYMLKVNNRNTRTRC